MSSEPGAGQSPKQKTKVEFLPGVPVPSWLVPENAELDADNSSANIDNGSPLLLFRRIAALTSDNVFTVRAGVASINKEVFEKGILSDLLTLYNQAAANPIVKKAFEFSVVSDSAVSLIDTGYKIAEKLIGPTNRFNKLTSNYTFQFINPGGYPRYRQLALPIYGDNSDCLRPAKARKNCVLIEIDFVTSRSLLGVWDLQKRQFQSDIDADSVWRNAKDVLKVKSTDEFIVGGNESLKTFVSDVRSGAYKPKAGSEKDAAKSTFKEGLYANCGLLKQQLSSVFTDADAKALYWAFITMHWFSLQDHPDIQACIGTDRDMKIYKALNLEFPSKVKPDAPGKASEN